MSKRWFLIMVVVLTFQFLTSCEKYDLSAMEEVNVTEIERRLLNRNLKIIFKKNVEQGVIFGVQDVTDYYLEFVSLGRSLNVVDDKILVDRFDTNHNGLEVSVIGIGSNTYVGVFIRDNSILSRADSVTLIFRDNAPYKISQTLSKSHGLLFEVNGKFSLQSIQKLVISDQNNQSIFEAEL